MKTLFLPLLALGCLSSCTNVAVVEPPPKTVTVKTTEKETIYRRYPNGIVQTQTTTY